MKKLIDVTNSTATRDPYVMKHNGRYYRCYSDRPNSIYISCADTVDGLKTAVGKAVYTAEQGKEYSKELWAPELHVLDGKCYIYVACDDGDNHNHRMYVLENGSDDPMQSYTMHGKIFDDTDKWAIDGTIFEFGGKTYFIWAGWEGDENVRQDLYIAEMASPFALSGKRHLISTPQYDWEKIGSTGAPESPLINEGPFIVRLNGETYLLYSAAGSWCTGYCIAALKLVGDDPLDRACWKKFDRPIFSSNELVQGAGHCSAVNEHGKALVFFHAWDRDEKEIVWNTVSVWQAELKAEGDFLTIQ